MLVEVATSSSAPRRGFCFCTNSADIRQDDGLGRHQHRRMEDLNDDDILAEAIADVAFDVLSRIGDDPGARYAFFRQFLELAQEAVGETPASEREAPDSSGLVEH